MDKPKINATMVEVGTGISITFTGEGGQEIGNVFVMNSKIDGRDGYGINFSTPKRGLGEWIPKDNGSIKHGKQCKMEIGNDEKGYCQCPNKAIEGKKYCSLHCF